MYLKPRLRVFGTKKLEISKERAGLSSFEDVYSIFEQLCREMNSSYASQINIP